MWEWYIRAGERSQPTSSVKMHDRPPPAPDAHGCLPVLSRGGASVALIIRVALMAAPPTDSLDFSALIRSVTRTSEPNNAYAFRARFVSADKQRRGCEKKCLITLSCSAAERAAGRPIFSCGVHRLCPRAAAFHSAWRGTPSSAATSTLEHFLHAAV